MFAILLAGSLARNLTVLLVAILFSVVAQVVSLLLYVKWENTDIFVSDRKKRGPLFFVAVVSYALGSVVLYYMHAPFIATALMLAYAINTVAASLINEFYKVSMHVWSISGPAIALLYQYGIVVCLAAVIAALFVGHTRILMKAHTGGQVLLALLVSIPLTGLIIYYLAPAII